MPCPFAKSIAEARVKLAEPAEIVPVVEVAEHDVP
jgi:hypothetical protein